ncbi:MULTISPECIES: hypothetical protein [unclassified Fusibacter]|uniref:hypothetical protein n=1 Tax=unclassified Fusibacter TaxID=2624464 RepID=UPI001011C883|nr:MULTISPECIES: hypothetical protein [unclassified Fusibacter]MCK8058730.1 hypothetical protein [Fusibacter sp. A2]NPE21804.1 hypothetical protein [Fusibacter sp. A1]RXV61376.1 hypothetical protein DWB64_08170 [Fusibacter sp. A1]
MFKNNLLKILSEYDFTDSIIVEISTSKLLTELVLEIDYYWDLQEGKNEARMLLLKFENCKRIESRIPVVAIESLKSRENVDSYFTIVKTLQEEESTLSIFNGIGNDPFLRIEFGSVELSEQ